MKHKLRFALALLGTALAGLGGHTTSFAEELNKTRISVSAGYSGQIDEIKRVQKLNEATPDLMPELSKEGFRSESGPAAKNTAAQPGLGEVYIATASTTLYRDWDDDGFFHRFSIHFDANTGIGYRQWVYARLYLSFEGGPWNLYASTDDFLLEDDRLTDDYTVETDLLTEYPAGYYDIRIELHDADSGSWLTTYGPYDDLSLSALPLEDKELDDADYYYRFSVSGGGGQAGLGFLALSGLLGFARHFSRRKQKPSSR